MLLQVQHIPSLHQILRYTDMSGSNRNKVTDFLFMIFYFSNSALLCFIVVFLMDDAFLVPGSHQAVQVLVFR